MHGIIMRKNASPVQPQRPPNNKAESLSPTIQTPTNSGQQQQKQLKTASPESRNSLRQEVQLRRASLTPQELGFLAKLIEDGSEIEVSIAKSKLADESLFFMQEQEEDATSAPSSPTPEELNSRTKPPPLKSVCSEELARRQALLDERRNSYLHGQIWKAHQNGLAVTQASSRKSFMRREQSWTANRRSAAKHSNLLSSKEIAEIKEKLVLQRGSSFLIDGGSGSTRSRRASIGTYTRNNQRHQLPVLPPLGRTVSGPVASLRRMGSSSFSSQASAPRIPGYRPPTNIVPESGTSMKCQDTAPKSSLSTAQMGSAFQRRNNVAGAARPPLRRMSSAPVTPSGPLLLKQHDSTSTEDGSSPPPLPVGVPFRQQRLSNGGDVASEKDGSITKQATVPHHPPLRHSRRSTLRQLSSSSSGLVGIPEVEERKRSRQQQKIIENMRKEVQTSASSEWEGTVLPEEMEDKKMSDEEELELFRSHSQSQSTEWLNALQLRRASVSSYGGEGMEIAATFLDYEYDQFDMAETVYEDEEKGSDQDMDKTLIEEYEEELTDDTEGSSSTVKNAAIMRRASINVYGGEGMEISDWDAQEDLEERRETIDTYRLHSIELQPAFGENERMAFRPCVSFDETKSLDRPKEDIVLAKNIPRSFSEDELSSLLTAQRKARARERCQSDAMTATTLPENESYDTFEYDAWVDVPEDLSFDTLPFRILGTSAEDVDAHPHVLSPPLMESLQSFFPLAKTSDNFWLKYSLVRDGASMRTLLQYARGAQFAILALETVDGEVMGAFTTEPWRKTWNYFGGADSFLWRLRHSRKTKCHSIIDQAHLESEIDVFPFAGENDCIQICRSDLIAVGGGSQQEGGTIENGADESSADPPISFQEHDLGHGIALQSDLLHGSSSPCITFKSPSLSETHNDGSLFEIINLEIWALTPCYHVEDAEKLELGKLFLEDHTFNVDGYDESLGDIPSF